MSITIIASASTAGGPSGGTTGAMDTTGADLILVITHTYVAGGTPSVSDSKGNTYVQRATAGLGDARVQLWECRGGTVGTGHTVTVSGGIYGGCKALAVSGSHATPFEDDEVATGSGGTLQTAALTPSANNALVVAGIASYPNYASSSIDGGFTIADDSAASSGSHIGGALAYLIQTTAAAAQPTWTSAAENKAAVLGVYLAAAGGPAVPALDEGMIVGGFQTMSGGLS